VVWSDPTVQELSRQFVPVADEAYLLYPEHPEHLRRVADDPAHQLFRRFGEAMPSGAWNHRGTKQGIYMLGPDGEYLEGLAAASGDPADIAVRLRRALQRWDELRQKKRYRNAPVPANGQQLPCDLDPARMTLRVSLRDLAGGEAVTPRWQKGAFDDRNWATWIAWAWNQNWFQPEDPRAFVTAEATPVDVAPAAFRRLCREVLVDNVRGQAPHWEDRQVEHAVLRMRRLAAGKTWRIEYSGEARMNAGAPRLAVRLYGQGEWDPAQNRFVRFDLLALGTREGAHGANQREQQRGPSPIGIALRLFAGDGDARSR
jgi:hypothetical protein